VEQSNPLPERHLGCDEFEVRPSGETGLTVSDLLPSFIIRMFAFKTVS
jgi:hypothetical protein